MFVCVCVFNLIDIYGIDGSIFYSESTISRWRKVRKVDPTQMWNVPTKK